MAKIYDVALSFAGEQREYVHNVADTLKARGARVFYDEHEFVAMWGKDFTHVSKEIYGGEKSHCVVVFASRAYVAKPFPKLELQHTLAQAIREGREYVLVARFDDVVLPGLPDTIVHVDLRGKAPDEFAEIVVKKLRHLGIQLALGGTTDIGSLPLSEHATLLMQKAEQGDTVAQYNLGVEYEHGRNVPQDYDKAVKYYRFAAKKGLAFAQFNLGVLCDSGRGVPQNQAEAAKYYALAAEQGVAEAQFSLGSMYDNGHGLLQNYVKAAEWWLRAAEQGHAGAQFNLGNMYYNGRGVQQDYTEAVKWWLRATEQGHAGGQNNVGVIHRDGNGVPQNGAEAVKWFLRAAEQGLADAQCNLSDMYHEGRGVSQDHANAVKWRLRAAKQGHAGAQNSLGVNYTEGNGIVRDYVQAYKWFNLAAAQGSEDAKKNIEIVTRQMTRDQIAEAQRLAAQFRPRKESGGAA